MNRDGIFDSMRESVELKTDEEWERKSWVEVLWASFMIRARGGKGR